MKNSRKLLVFFMGTMILFSCLFIWSGKGDQGVASSSFKSSSAEVDSSKASIQGREGRSLTLVPLLKEGIDLLIHQLKEKGKESYL